MPLRAKSRLRGEHGVGLAPQRVQRPDEKINHCLLLGGSQGIGKDTALEPVKHAVGPWNFQEVSPTAMLGRFNGFLRAVILRISEARVSLASRPPTENRPAYARGDRHRR